MPSKLSRTTTDHDEIRRWAEERGGQPAEVMGTERGDTTGMIRIDFPGFSGAGRLKPIGWDEWFQKFDASGLALVYQERTSGGQRSNFNKLIARETAEAREEGVAHASRRRLRTGGGATEARARRGGGRAGARGRGSTSRRSGGARRGAAGEERQGQRSRGRTSAGAGRSGGRSRTRTTSRGRATQGSREAPTAVAARLTGRGRSSDAPAAPRKAANQRQRTRAASQGGRSRSTGRKGSASGRTTRRSGRRR